MKKRSIGKTIADRLSEFAAALEANSGDAKQFTSRQVTLRLEPASYSPALVKETRAILNASQAIFAKFLGVSVDAVQAWETGVNSPSDIAARFMDEIRANPEFWRQRFASLIVHKVGA